MKKYFFKHFMVQVPLILLNTLVLLSGAVSLENFSGLVLMQCAIGGFQLYSAFAHYAGKELTLPARKRRWWHLAISAGLVLPWIMLLGLSNYANVGYIGNLHAAMSAMFVFVVPQILAYYYFYISYLDYKENKQASAD